MSHKYDVSILMPAIRTPKWHDMYKSILQSCKKYTFELVLISPFDLPEDMKQYNNIKLIKDFGCPSRCAQLGISHCEGRLVYHCVDDALFLKNSIDAAIFLYDYKCGPKDVVNMRYREGQNFSGQTFDAKFWNAHTHAELRLKGIPNEFKISCHHLLSLEYLKELGGWDCRFEYINHALHDLMFRVQEDGGILYDSPIDATSCDHFLGRTGDHAAIHDAQEQADAPKFHEMYAHKEHAAKDRINIPLDNWQQQPDNWDRRFKGTKPKEYNELLVLNEGK